MRAFNALMWKEWRDARGTVLVAAAGALLATIAWHELVPAALTSGWTAGFALVLLPTLFTTVLSGDLVADEARGGRLASLRALPVSPIASFAAKLVWLSIASVLFFGLCFALQLPYVAGDEAWAAFLREAERALPLMSLGAALGAGALFASSLAVGGLKAMLLSALLVGLPLVTVVLLSGLTPLPFLPHHLSLYALAFSVAALAAAAIGWCRGGLHLGARWRPALVGWSALVLCALPPSALAAYGVARWRRLEPGSERVDLEWLLASPDGRYLAVQAIAWQAIRWGPVDSRDRSEAAVWMIDLEDGDMQRVPGENWLARRWSEAGELIVVPMHHHGTQARRTAQRVDPGELTLRAIETPSELRDAWLDQPEWARIESAPEAGRAVRLHWIGRELSVALPPLPVHFMPQHVPGVALFWSASGLERVELDGARTMLFEGLDDRRRTHSALSLDDRYLLAEPGGAGAVLDAHSGEVLAGPWPGCAVHWLHGAPLGRFVVLRHDPGRALSIEGQACSLYDLESGRLVELGRLMRDNTGSHPDLCRLPDGRLVVLRPDDTVELLGPDGARLRTLLDASGSTSE